MRQMPEPEMSGEDIYRNFHNGVGPNGLVSSVETVLALVERYQGRIDQALRWRARMEAAWQGAAAGAADRGLAPLVIEHAAAGRALYKAQDLTSRQAGSFVEARNAVVPVPPAPVEVDALAMISSPGVALSYHVRMSQHQHAAQHNVDVMDGYAGASRYNTDGQPTAYGVLVGEPVDVSVGSAVDDGSVVDGERSADRRGSAGAGGVAGPVAVAPEGDEPGSAVTRPGAVAGTVPADGTGAAVADNGVTRPGGWDSVVRSGLDSGGGVGTAAGAGRGGWGGGFSGAGGEGQGVGGRGVGGGFGVGPAPAGSAARPVLVVGGPGRGGVGFAGVPAPSARSRDTEDGERTAPSYLDGGDPEELWDTDELTAPPAIGDEDG